MRTRNKLVLIFFCLLLSAAAVLAGVNIYSELKERQKEKEDFAAVSQIAEPTVTAAQTETEPTEQPAAERNIQALIAENSDCIGWLSIDGTNISYPVMHTPSEPQRYLRLNFDKEYSSAGVPFLKGKCTMECDNLVIYGHNMKNGTMFSDVTQYRNKDYCTEHPVIEFETAEGMKQYTVFAVVYVKNNDGWYDFHTADNETEFNEKIEEIKHRALYDTGITPEYGQ